MPVSQQIVAVDFGSIGGGTPLSQSLGRIDSAARRVRVVNPLDASWRSDVDSLTAHAGTAAERLLTGGLDRHAVVVAQCTGALFGLTLAAFLTGSGASPAAVVLVDPLLVTPTFV